MKPFFPPWFDNVAKLTLALIVGGGVYAVTLICYATSPVTTSVGYQPDQPIPYSHALHVGQLGLDCRYCHTTVDKAAFAAIPPTQTCMNCHANIRNDSEKLTALRESFKTGSAVEWVQIHDLPDFVYFNHSAHVNNGIGCVSCHGRVDKMAENGVHQVELLTMAWCLECHRNPEKNLRPLSEITNMAYEVSEEEQLRIGTELRQALNVNPSTDCSTCHR
jgi:hypothetical protein